MFGNLSSKQKFIIQSVLILLSLVYVIPLFNVLLLSFRGGANENYTQLFKTGMPIGRMLFNSFLVSFLQVIFIVFISSISAFAFSKMDFKFKGILYTLVMLTMSIPLIALMTPLFTILKGLHLTNTYAALVLPAATFYMPVAILIQKNYYDALGNEMMEAALVDGSSWFGIYKNIYFPIGLPATINVVVFAFMQSWNDYLNPLLFSKTMDMYTFPMAIVSVTTTIRGSRPEVVAACLVIMAIPSIILYISLQKYLGEGMTAGAVKG